MLDLGTVRPGTTLYIPFHTFDSNDPSASVTITGLATTDIEIYKNGGTTQRASDAGYALLDTDGIDFDTTTGIHGISINLADDTTADFYTAGAQYWVVIASITVDDATVNFIAATFRIGYPDAIINTTVTVGSQTSVTLADGPAEASALVGCPVILHDKASAVQVSHSIITAYAATTKVATITAPTFTIATGDNISVFMPSNTRWAGATAWGSGAITAGSIASSAITANSIASGAITSAKIASGAITSTGIAANAIGASQIASNAITSAKIATDAIGAAQIAADAIGSSELAATAASEIADAVWDEAQADHTSVGSFGETATEIADILTDTADMQPKLGTVTDLGGGATLAANNSDMAGATFSTATDSQEAIRDRGDSAWTTATGFSTHAAADVWSVATRVLTANTNLNDPTAATIADAVWDEARTDHTTQGTYGESMDSVISANVNDASATTVGFITDLTEATDDHYNGRVIIFTSGALDGQATDITDYNGTTKAVTVTALTEAPADGDDFIIV